MQKVLKKIQLKLNSFIFAKSYGPSRHLIIISYIHKVLLKSALYLCKIALKCMAMQSGGQANDWICQGGGALGGSVNNEATPSSLYIIYTN